ncbi:MAG: ribosome-associated translation inhibitor RaiA [Parcubacteria group bacterium]|nr:ribosome-associated translation inhibitor RaiA [Parcubacteria group bacterium]
MQIQIKTTNYTLSDEVRTYLEKRLAGFEKFLDESAAEALCNVELEHEHAQQHGRVFRAEVNLNAHGEFYRAEDTGESMNAAIDGVHDEIARRLRRGKNKHMSMIRRGGAQIKEWLRWGEDA